MAVELNNIFDSAVKNSLFKNKSVLQVKYTPESIPHRDEQIKSIASILASCLRNERPSNLFVYGKTGTGKTLSIQYVMRELTKKAKEVDVEVSFEYINCKLRKVADTEYRILAALIKQLGGDIPATGLPTDKVWNKFIEIIDKKKQLIVFVFDEIDQAIKKMSDTFLYSLTRLNQELNNAQISIIGISNDVTFLENIDPRVRSSLGEEEFVFPPYNAIQLQDILNERCLIAFKEKVIKEGVIAKCAAYAAREHGDARRALDLLRIAAELCEREGKLEVEEKYIDLANQKMEKDKILDIVETIPKQHQLVLLSIMNLNKEQKNKKIEKYFTGDVYNLYQELCLKTKTESLTQRRISDILADIDMLGIINAKVISKGRHGRTREIKLSVPDNLLDKMENLLKDSLGF
ncbi:MAG: orc1/cdc6 family replication initiation protein [Candidatus Nanoarchaeia archaeon]|jgi:cell division control protein 6|nr:orc1/cdc6 family replication initiation protein [Candidatus Nanoarchaeia archaeon]MDD3993767.1 orc1/cdc6 family replication initiation protein [Candidatus Nanoarchaeia archaeon]MDD4563461.1 orc1/cdc6 family replication initiation protein [Candidatus Nanoarchaeia archaeon]